MNLNKNKSMKILVFLFLLGAPLFSVSQTKNEKKISEHQRNFNIKAKTLGISEYGSKDFYKLNININKIKEFKTEGIDLIALSEIISPGNYGETSLYSHAIVQGTIISKTYHPGSNNYFHTTYEIQVSNVLKGNISQKVIELKTVSGLLDGDKEIYETALNEPSFFIGEEALFCMNIFDIQYYEEGRKYSSSLIGKEFNIKPNQFIIQDKYYLKAGYFYDRLKGRIGTQEKVISTVKRITEINRVVNFDKVKF